MSGGHTPGEWVAICDDVTEGLERGDSGIRFWSIRSAGPYRGDIASVHAAEHIGGIKLDERDANAALIAAAPDLLASCEELLEPFLIASEALQAEGRVLSEHAHATFDRARAAIARTKKGEA